MNGEYENISSVSKNIYVNELRYWVASVIFLCQFIVVDKRKTAKTISSGSESGMLLLRTRKLMQVHEVYNLWWMG